MTDVQWKDSVRAQVLQDFVGIIRKHVVMGFGVAVDASYFRKMPVEKRKLLGGKDCRDFTFHQLLRIVQNDLEMMKREDWLSIVFDYEDGFALDCLRSLFKLRKTHPSIRHMVKQLGSADDEIFYQLQAADMFAYGYRGSLLGNPPSYWKALTQPSIVGNQAPRCIVSYFDSVHLEDVCAQAKELSKRSKL